MTTVSSQPTTGLYPNHQFISLSAPDIFQTATYSRTVSTGLFCATHTCLILYGHMSIFHRNKQEMCCYQYYTTNAGVQCLYGAHCVCNFDFTVTLSATDIETEPSVCLILHRNKGSLPRKWIRNIYGLGAVIQLLLKDHNSQQHFETKYKNVYEVRWV